MISYTKKIEQAFPKMAEILKPCESEHFAISYNIATEEDVKLCQLRDAIHGRGEYDGFKAGTYIKLRRKPSLFDEPIMSDTFMEKETQFEVLENAHGDVLIAGLGIGMVLLAIQDLPSVSSVTVVEKEQEIIDLVKPQLPLNNKVSVVLGDIFTYETTAKFDTIYFDIWDNICGDNWEQMKKLQRRFRSRLKKGGWMSCWRKEDCKYAAKH
jgi:hypothetical protein